MNLKVGDYVEITPRYFNPPGKLGRRICGLPGNEANLYEVNKIMGRNKERLHEGHAGKLFYPDELKKMSKAGIALYKLRQ